MKATNKVIKSQMLLKYWMLFKKVWGFIKALLPVKVPLLKRSFF